MTDLHRHTHTGSARYVTACAACRALISAWHAAHWGDEEPLPPERALPELRAGLRLLKALMWWRRGAD